MELFRINIELKTMEYDNYSIFLVNHIYTHMYLILMVRD